MRFRDNRQVVLKGIDTPEIPPLDAPNVPWATPKFISPTASGYMAAQMADKSAPQRVPNRTERRRLARANRHRWRMAK